MFPMHSAPIRRCSPSTSAVCPPVIRRDHGTTLLSLHLCKIEPSGHRFIGGLFVFYCFNHIPYIFGNLGTVNWIVPTMYHSMHFSCSFIPNRFVISLPYSQDRIQTAWGHNESVNGTTQNWMFVSPWVNHSLWHFFFGFSRRWSIPCQILCCPCPHVQLPSNQVPRISLFLNLFHADSPNPLVRCPTWPSSGIFTSIKLCLSAVSSVLCFYLHIKYFFCCNFIAQAVVKYLHYLFISMIS